MAKSGFGPQHATTHTDLSFNESHKFVKAGENESAILTNDVTAATNILDVSAEAVTLAAGAQGTTGSIALDKAPIYNSIGVQIGNSGDTSFAFVTGTILTTEVAFDYNATDAAQLAALANGEYAVDYRSGKILYKKDTADTADTVNYKSRQVNSGNTGGPVSVTLAPGDVEIGAVEIKNESTDDRVNVSDANTARAATDHVMLVQNLDAAGGIVAAADVTAIKTAVELLDNVVAGSEMQVDVVTSALPTGAATEATLVTIDADTSSLAGCVAGTELQADIVSSALPTGAATETTLDAVKTSVELLDDAAATISATPLIRMAMFDDSDSQITSFGGAIQYTEDDAVPANPKVGAGGMERDDVLGGITPAEGDWTHQFSTAEGALWVQDFNSDAILADTDALAGCVGGTELQVDIVSSALPTGAATEATLVTIDADTSAIAGCVGGTEMQVDVVTSALPTGAATEATLVTIDADTSALAGCVGGTELQVDIVSSSLPTGASTAANQVTIIGHVDGIESALEEMAGGTSTIFKLDGDNTAQVCKAAAGTLYNVDIYNPNAAAAFFQVFDVAAGSVTVGTTTPKYVLFVPPSGAASIPFSTPMEFTTAITYACTTTATGAGDPTTGLTVSIAYK